MNLRNHHGQMSESLLTASFIILSGGLQDAYTYLCRGKVFANAQTGNIVLLSQHLFTGDFLTALHYLIPLVAFASGILAAELFREHFQSLKALHWRQMIVLAEILLLFSVGFFPQELNLLANAIVSFSCAMQVQTFRKVNGYAYASTMCIGNMRSGMEALAVWIVKHDPKALRKVFHYLGIIFLFGVGAGLGWVAPRSSRMNISAKQMTSSRQDHQMARVAKCSTATQPRPAPTPNRKMMPK